MPKAPQGSINLTVAVPIPLYRRLQRLEWGFRRPLVCALLEAVMEAYEREGDLILGAICSGNFVLKYESKRARERRRKRYGHAIEAPTHVILGDDAGATANPGGGDQEGSFNREEAATASEVAED